MVPFPVEVLPPALADFVREAAAALDCPTDWLGPPMLAAAGAALGQSRVLRIKENLCERAAIYLALLAPAGSSQAAALRTVAEPIYEAQAQLLAEHEQHQARYDIDLYNYEPPFDRPEVVYPWDEEKYRPREKPVRPILTRRYAADATVGSLPGMLQDNPRGTLVLREDLPAWLAGMNAGKGCLSERQIYLAAWSGEPLCVDRKRAQLPVLVLQPFLSVISGLSPERLSLLRQERGRTDCLLDRFLFAFPDPWPAAKWNQQVLTAEARENWAAVLQFLWDLKGDEDRPGHWRPRDVHFSSDGAGAWECFFNRLSEEINRGDFAGHLRGTWLRLQNYGARLALVLHYLWWAAAKIAGARRQPEVPVVEAVSVERAQRLIEYFKGHARKVHASMSADPKVNKARVVLQWIERSGLREFTRREVHHALFGTFRTVAELEPGLDVLWQYGYLRQRPSPGRPGPGRKPSPIYEVNPHWLRVPDSVARPESAKGVECSPTPFADSGRATLPHLVENSAEPGHSGDSVNSVTEKR